MQVTPIRLIDQYIIKKYLGTFIFTMVIFVVVLVIFDISEHLDDFFRNHAPFSKVVFEFYAGFIPYYLNFLCPLINFIAVIFFTAKMANQTEIIPIFNSGVSFTRFLYPYFIASGIVFIITFIFNLFIIPATNKLMIGFHNIYISPAAYNTKTNVHMQISKDTYLHIENFDNNLKVGYRFSLEKFRGQEMKERLIAEEIRWDSLKNAWRINNYSLRTLHGLSEEMHYNHQDSLLPLDIQPSDFEIHDNIFEAMSMNELLHKMEQEKLRGTGILTNLELEYYKRFVYPLSSFVLTIIGVCLSSKKVRGGIGLSLGVGIFLSFSYILFVRFSTIFALKGGLHPLIAVFIPNLIFGFLAIYLVIKAPK